MYMWTDGRADILNNVLNYRKDGEINGQTKQVNVWMDE